MTSSATTSLKRLLLPEGTKLRKLPLGIGRGAVMPIDFSRHTRLYLGLYEIELNRYLRTFCSPGLPSFDVGAQLGYDAVVLARLTHAPVIAFEADRALAEEMGGTLAANSGIEGLVVARHATIGRPTGETGTVALDDVAYGDGFVPGLIKLDIDGGEVDALEGASRILREGRPHLIIETHSKALERDCAHLMRAAGYRPRIVHQRRVWPDHRPTAHNRWLIAEGSPQAFGIATSS